MAKKPRGLFASIRDGALVGVLLYSVVLAAHLLRDPLAAQGDLSPVLRSYLDGADNMVRQLGIKAPLVFMGVGAAIGAFPFRAILRVFFGPKPARG